MNFNEETSKYDMTDFYKVLKYLPKSSVDRQEPCVFDKVFVEGSKVVIPTIHGEFNGTDNLQLFVNCHNVNVDVNTVKVGFSPLVNGNVPVLELNCSNDDLDLVNDTIIQFTIDENYSATDNSRLLTGIESIVIDFGSDATGVEIQKLLLRSVDYTYTLADLDVACQNGKAYVLRRLNHRKNELKHFNRIPSLLQQYVYMAAGAYAWLTRWEYEAKPMKEPKSESNNYADRLFTQVDDAITRFVNNMEDDEYIHTYTSISTGVDWGIN